ncbi:MAG: hypothetical protein WBB28_24485 [Crinalium sp.]
MQAELSNKIQYINNIIKLVSLANEQLKTKNNGKFSKWEILVDVKFLTNGQNNICQVIQFTMMEEIVDDDGCKNSIEITKGSTWLSFIDSVKYELGNRFINLTGLTEIPMSANIRQEIKSNDEQKDPDDLNNDFDNFDDDDYADNNNDDHNDQIESIMRMGSFRSNRK